MAALYDMTGGGYVSSRKLDTRIAKAILCVLAEDASVVKVVARTGPH